MTVPQILVYGTVCLDQFLLPGHTEAIEFPGGEAFNTATALAGWNIPVALAGTAIGDDAEGLRLRELLQTHPLAQGIDTALVPRFPGACTPVCTIQVDDQGERTMSGRGFQQATPPSLDTLSAYLAKQPVFTVDPNLGESALEATRMAHTAGCPILSMDCAGVPEILAVSAIAVTSQEWINRLGWDLDAETAAKRIGSIGANHAIVTLGAEGGVCYESTTGTVHRYPAIIPSTPIIDTTGAGDTFRAGLCFGLILQHYYGLKIEDSFWSRRRLLFAASAAALHCTKIGGGSRFLAREVFAIMKSQSNT